jgi:hypothetical protein
MISNEKPAAARLPFYGASPARTGDWHGAICGRGDLGTAFGASAHRFLAVRAALFGLAAPARVVSDRRLSWWAMRRRVVAVC